VFMDGENLCTVYRTRFLVRARQLTEPLVFTDALGREQSGQPGDYLVESSEGIKRITAKILFEDIYVPLLPAVPEKPAPEKLVPGKRVPEKEAPGKAARPASDSRVSRTSASRTSLEHHSSRPRLTFPFDGVRHSAEIGAEIGAETELKVR